MIRRTVRKPSLSRRLAELRLIGAVVLLSFFTSRAVADPPSVSSLYPAGVQRGQSVDVTINGKPGTAPVQAWTESEALTLTMSEDAKTLTVVAAESAEPGLHWVRLYNAEGATDLQPFFVGLLPESNEAEPNDASDEVTVTELPMVVNGILNKSGDVDTYSVPLESGQTLLASIEAHRSLSSPMDGILQVLSPGGFVLEQNDDDHGVDPQLAFTAAETGLHSVRVFGFPADPNSTVRFAGGGDYVYRLTLTTGPFIDHLAPGGPDSPELLSVVGWNLPSDQMTLDEAVQMAGLHQVRRFAPGEPAAVSEAHASRALPLRVIGHLSAPGEVDAYPFAATGGESLKIGVRARAVERPLDAVLRILNEAGEELQENDDAGRNVFDPALTWNAPADGTYRIEVRDRFGHGGPRYVYDLSVVPEQPDVELQVKADHFKIKPGASLDIEVTVNRRGGFNTELQIGAEGLPEGVTCAAVTSPAEGDAAKSVTLKLEAAEGVTSGGPMRIAGTGPDKGSVVATAALKLSGERTEWLWLTVGP
jgi:hypothetical protein